MYIYRDYTELLLLIIQTPILIIQPPISLSTNAEDMTVVGRFGGGVRGLQYTLYSARRRIQKASAAWRRISVRECLGLVACGFLGFTALGFGGPRFSARGLKRHQY